MAQTFPDMWICHAIIIKKYFIGIYLYKLYFLPIMSISVFKQNRNRTLVLHFKYQGSTICYQLYILLRGSLNSGNLETTLQHKRCEAALTNDINTSNLSKAELCQIRNGFLSPDSGCNIVQNIHQYNYYFIITLYLYYVST